ncbi:MAG: hypothetical protein U5K84_10890 [Alkalibacterium sp.]|nr:hypothetical protein [Alkalibacterium sp.]
MKSAGAIEEIAKGASEQAADTEKGSKQIDELGDLVVSNENYLRELNASTRKVDELKNEGATTLKELIGATESITAPRQIFRISSWIQMQVLRKSVMPAT